MGGGKNKGEEKPIGGQEEKGGGKGTTDPLDFRTWIRLLSCSVFLYCLICVCVYAVFYA